jgi:hypothetical protein
MKSPCDVISVLLLLPPGTPVDGIPAGDFGALDAIAATTAVMKLVRADKAMAETRWDMATATSMLSLDAVSRVVPPKVW